MTTRRQKLHDIFADCVANGVTTADLLEDIESFTAGGGSGIETWLNETRVSEGQSPEALVKQHLKAALDLLS